MKIRSIQLFIGVLLSFFVVLSVSANPVDDVQLSDVEEFWHDGIQIIIRPSENVPSVTVLLYLKGGASVMTGDEQAAREYMAMNLIPGSSGTAEISKQYYRRKMLRMGSGIGGGDGRDFSVVTMRSTREHFDTTWKFFSQKVLQPTIDQTEFNNLKNNALVGLSEGRLNPETVARMTFDSIYFQGHPYDKRLKREYLAAVTPEQVVEHFKSIAQKSRLLMVVVGNITKKELTRSLDKYKWGELPQGNFVMPELPPPSKSMSPGAYFPKFERSLPTKYVRGYMRIPSKGSPDYYPYVRLRNFFGGFLFQHLRVQTNLSYAPNFDDVEARESYAVISFETSLVDSAVRMVLRDIDFFQNNTLLESAIKGGVARYTTTQFLKQESTPEVAGALGQAQILTGSWKNAFVSFDKLSNISPESLRRVANTYMKNINWVIIGDTTDVSRQLLESR